MLSANDPRLPGLIQQTEEAARYAAEGHPERSAELYSALLSADAWPPAVTQKLTHNLATALRQIAARKLPTDAAAAESTAERLMALETVSSLPPGEIRARAEVLHSAGTDFMHAGQWKTAAQLLRRAIALYPCPTFSNNLINTLARSGAPSLLTDYCDAPGVIPARRIFIAAQPKSGSTFLKNTLIELTGWRDVYFCHHTEMASQDLHFPALLEFLTTPTVTHQHVRASEPNIQLMQAFHLTPVVLLRPLFDVLASLQDYLSAGAVRGTAFDVTHWMESSPERQMDLLIDFMVPWHLEFLAGWQRAARLQRLLVHWLCYDELTAAPATAVSRLLSLHQMNAEADHISAALERTRATPERNRFNKGISGRGDASLTSGQKDRIRQMATAFPDTDWAPYAL